jgi:hypothetical protein
MKRREFITLLGSAAAWPLTALAQQAARSYRISFLALTPGEDRTLMQALLERLHELGYREGTSMTFKYRSAEGHPERLAPLAMDRKRTRYDDHPRRPQTIIAPARRGSSRALDAVTPRNRGARRRLESDRSRPRQGAGPLGRYWW